MAHGVVAKFSQNSIESVAHGVATLHSHREELRRLNQNLT
jgi:hypothetical protein